MHCKNCGIELSEDSKFCGSCGAALQGEELSATPPSQAMAVANTLVQDGKSFAAKIFTKNPALAIQEAAKSRSAIWAVLIAANALLFALAACLNAPQLVAHIVNSLLNSVKSMASAVMGSALAGSMVGSYLPSLKIPPLWQLLVPLALLAAVSLFAEIGGIYIALTLAHQKPQSYANVANVVGVASLPLSVAFAANLLLGAVYPPATLFAFLAAALVNMVLLYEGLREILGGEKAPVLGFAVVVVLLCAIVLVVFEIAVGQAGEMVQQAILSTMGGALTDQLGPMLGALLGS